MYTWINGTGQHKQSYLDRLTKEAVRNHKNIRLSGEGGAPSADGSFGQNAGHQVQADIHGYIQSHVPGAQHLSSSSGGPGSYVPSQGGHGGHQHGGHGHGHGNNQSSSPFAPSYGGGGGGGGMPGLPNIPGLNLQGLSALGKMTGLREMPGEPGGYPSEPSYGGSTSSAYAPSYAPPSHDQPSSFPGMPPREQSSSTYAPSYSAPSEPFGYTGNQGPQFPGAPGGDYNQGGGGGYPGGGGQWNGPPPTQGPESPYGFAPSYPGGPPPPGGPGYPGGPPPPGGPGFPGAQQGGYGGYQQGGW